MWAHLSDEGKKVWGDVFPDGNIPVCSFNFQEADLEGAGTERVILVNWTSLSKEQKDAILTKISQKSGAPKETILKDILKIGLPLRKRYTTGYVAAESRFFI